MKKQRIVIGNWKMNPSTIGEAKRMFMSIRTKLAKASPVTVVIAPPAPYLAELRKLSMGKRILLGAQNVHAEKAGPYTGDVSASMLRSVGAAYIIVGHSERRAIGETDADVNEKVKMLLKEQLVPVVCVGERERTESGAYFEMVEAQLRAAFAGVPKAQAGKVIVAYEPVWAISSGDGKGATASVDDVREMQLFIRRILSDLYGRTVGLAMPVIYGGSVNDSNAAELMTAGVDGFLPGGASLEPKAFVTIVKAVHGT